VNCRAGCGSLVSLCDCGYGYDGGGCGCCGGCRCVVVVVSFLSLLFCC